LSHLDHDGWAEALAGIETERSRELVKLRAKDFATSLLRSLANEDTVDPWKRPIYAEELRKRPAEEGRAAA
jgi:hypothetical protein